MKLQMMGRLTLAGLCAGAILATGVLLDSQPGRAQSTLTPGAFDPALVEIGLQISPVPVNLGGKNRNKVGFGSYLINAGGGCNDCHSNPPYSEAGDPYQGKPTKINVAGYLGGNQAFGPFLSRNITPDGTGKPAGMTLPEFKQIFRTGLDIKHLHPDFGPLLQVMPWPVYGNLVDRDIEALYEYLSAIPCLEGGPGNTQGRCIAAAVTTAVASPKGGDAISGEVVLDGSKSISADGKPLTYSWTIPSGYPPASMVRADTATPTVRFGVTHGSYAFDLTVTDSKGNTSTDRAFVSY